jgi:threonine dehydrogenase-like Zn-dependent dehydrogenase
MKQAVLTKDGFALREVAKPSCAPGEVLIRSAGIGVCEGEVVHYGHFLERGAAGEEAWMGHEASGTVGEVGAGVEGLAPGDPVTCNGGPFAEWFVASPGALALLPEPVEPRGALGEPVACCVHAAWRFGIRLGDTVAVVGVGFMGQVCMQLARLQGAAHVCALDLIPWRLPVAEQLGADATFNPEGMEPAAVLAELGEFDVVIEAAGTQSSVDLATALVRQHGRMVLVGYHVTGGGTRAVNMQQWNFKAIDVVHGHVRDNREKRDAMEAGVRLMAAGRLRVEPLITYYPLAEVGRAFEDLVARKEGLFKAVLVP